MPSTSTLDPRFRGVAEALLAHARGIDPRFVLTSARRTSTEQARLYARWLAGQNKFPALPPGKSMHEQGLAIDMHRRGVDPSRDPVLRDLGLWWRRQGGVWAGPRDPVHFEPGRLLPPG